MNAFVIIVAAFPAVLIVGAILMPVLAGRRAPRLSNQPRPEEIGAGYSGGNSQRAPIEPPEDVIVDVGSPDEFAAVEGDQYLTDWTALQDRFAN